jgi:hypothetical protein
MPRGREQRRPLILVVDDGEPIRQFAERILRDAGQELEGGDADARYGVSVAAGLWLSVASNVKKAVSGRSLIAGRF